MQGEEQKSVGIVREGAQRFAEQWPYLRYLGMGVWWAWIWLCYSSTSLFQYWPERSFADYVGDMYLYSTPAIALACAVAAICSAKVTPQLSNGKIVVAFGCAATAGTALVALSPWLGASPAFAIGGVLTGLGTSALCLKTGAVFGTLGRHEVLTAGCVSLMFAAFLFYMGTGIPVSWRPLFVAALPLASALLYIMPSEDPFAGEWPQSGVWSRSHVRLFICLAVAGVMVAATAGFAKGLVSASVTAAEFDYMGAAATFGIFLGALVICFLVNCGDCVKMTRFAYAALIFYGVVVVAFSGFGVNLVYLSVGKELLWMLFTCLMAYMVFRFDLSPVRAFGLGQAAYLLTSAAFWWFGMLMADALSGDTARIAVMAVMIVAIVLVFAFVFSDSDLKSVLTWARPAEDGIGAGSAARESVCAATLPEAEDGEGVQAAFPEGLAPSAEAALTGDAAAEAAGATVDGETTALVDGAYVQPREFSLHERVQLIDERFAITSREAEIMELFASGRSANWIAEDLVISKNTVRSHLRSIYMKLDVHTRQELLDFLNTVSSR